MTRLCFDGPARFPARDRWPLSLAGTHVRASHIRVDDGCPMMFRMCPLLFIVMLLARADVDVDVPHMLIAIATRIVVISHQERLRRFVETQARSITHISLHCH